LLLLKRTREEKLGTIRVMRLVFGGEIGLELMAGSKIVFG
jgi:hypothetical protein